MANWPLGWISICFVALFVGQLFSDLANPSSNIRKWLDVRLRHFVVESIWPRSNGDNIDLSMKLRARRKVRRSDIQIAIYRKAAHGFLSHEFTISLEKDAVFSAGEEKTYKLATIWATSGQVGEWPEAKPILDLGKYMIEIRTSFLLGTSCHRIYLEIQSRTNGTCGRFFFINESENPLELTELT